MSKNYDLTKLTPNMFNADHVSGDMLTLAKRDGGEVDRGALLKQLAAGELVELQVSYVAYVQDKKSNRNFVRFDDSALEAIAISGIGTPLLRDHRQGDISARAGTITDSSLVRRGESRATINQTATVTAPWAVEALLRGTIDRFSIGWNPTGPVNCSACGTEAFSDCYHFPGDVLKDKKSGKKTGTVEFIFTAAELIECSAVSVPAVPAARIKEIRAALSAQFERREMENETEDPILDHAEPVGAKEILSTGKQLEVAQLAIAVSQRDEALAQLASLSARLEAIEAEAKRGAEDQFIELGKREGKMNPKLEESYRLLYRANPQLAASHLDASPRINPVGAQLASASAPPVEALAQTSARDAIAMHGGSIEGVRRVLKALGTKISDEEISNRLIGEN